MLFYISYYYQLLLLLVITLKSLLLPQHPLSKFKHHHQTFNRPWRMAPSHSSVTAFLFPTPLACWSPRALLRGAGTHPSTTLFLLPLFQRTKGQHQQSRPCLVKSKVFWDQPEPSMPSLFWLRQKNSCSDDNGNRNQSTEPNKPTSIPKCRRHQSWSAIRSPRSCEGDTHIDKEPLSS